MVVEEVSKMVSLGAEDPVWPVDLAWHAELCSPLRQLSQMKQHPQQQRPQGGAQLFFVARETPGLVLGLAAPSECALVLLAAGPVSAAPTATPRPWCAAAPKYKHIDTWKTVERENQITTCDFAFAAATASAGSPATVVFNIPNAS